MAERGINWVEAYQAIPEEANHIVKQIQRALFDPKYTKDITDGKGVLGFTIFAVEGGTLKLTIDLRIGPPEVPKQDGHTGPREYGHGG